MEIFNLTQLPVLQGHCCILYSKSVTAVLHNLFLLLSLVGFDLTV